MGIKRASFVQAKHQVASIKTPIPPCIAWNGSWNSTEHHGTWKRKTVGKT